MIPRLDSLARHVLVKYQVCAQVNPCHGPPNSGEQPNDRARSPKHQKKKKTDFTKINPVQGGLNDLLLFIDTPSWFVKVVSTQTKATQIVS